MQTSLTYTQGEELKGSYDTLLQDYKQLTKRAEVLGNLAQEVTRAELRIGKCEALVNRSLFEREISFGTTIQMLFVVVVPALILKLLMGKRFINTPMDVCICTALYLMLTVIVGFVMTLLKKPAQ